MTQTPKKVSATPRASASRRQATKRNQWLNPVIIGSVVLALVVLLVVYAIWQQIGARSQATQPIEGLEQYPNQVQGHAEGTLSYAQTPPVGGVHNPIWQNCGVYTDPIPNEHAVHSLEHGAVWITYQPDLPAAEVEQLQTLTRQSRYRLLSPYPGLPSPIVISAWGYQLKLDKADDPRLQRFIERYEQNPLGPEPGASCSGGVGQPN